MTIDDIIKKFNTTPFLFVGSGMTRRYLNLPDWKGLLEHIARIIDNDDFIFSYYESIARTSGYKRGLLPKIAELIQKDFDERWYRDSNIRTVSDDILGQIKNNGLSPFKAEIAEYIKRSFVIESRYQAEIDYLSNISEKSIAGIITTNYDSFLEDHMLGFKKYVGQNELIFSTIQGIAEIYKIHGSVEEPGSIVINESDYVKFDDKSSYLAAKLMTIFVEYPIIFLGYSMGDTNIQNIISSIINCLDEKQVKMLEDRFVFVEYQDDAVGIKVSPFTIMINNKPLGMRKIVLSDYMLLYNAMSNKRAKLPIRILRRFKQELYDYTITNMTTANLRVAALDDSRISDDELVIAIGKVSDLGLRGLSGIDSNEWYRNIIKNDLNFTADELLEYAYPKLIRQNSGKLPVNKYLSESTMEFEECKELAKRLDFDAIISNTIKKNRNCLGDYTSIKQIWKGERKSLERATRLLSHLKEEQINISDLEDILLELFDRDINLLQTAPAPTRTNIRRLIMIYDYLKWGK